MVSLERWVVDVGVACEILEAEAVCHSPPCPQCDAWRLRIIHKRKEEGEKEEMRKPWCPSLCRIEGCNLGTGHRTPCITHGTVGFRSTSLEWHFPKLLHTQQLTSFTSCHPHLRLAEGQLKQVPLGTPGIACFAVWEKRGKQRWGSSRWGGNWILQSVVKRNLQLILYESYSLPKWRREGTWGRVRGQIMGAGALCCINMMLAENAPLTWQGSGHPQNCCHQLGTAECGGSRWGSSVCHCDVTVCFPKDHWALTG